MDGNYVKLSRGLLEWEWYSDINTSRMFIHMLLKANWKDGNFKGVIVPRGSFISSIGKLIDETGLTEREVRTAITHLKKTGEVTSRTTNRYTVFTVVKYDMYQTTDKQSDKQTSDKRQANDNLTTCKRQSNDKLTSTIEEGKNIKNERREEGKNNKKEGAKAPKKKADVYYPYDEKLNQAFAAFVEMRVKIKKPMTERAISMAMERLKKLSGEDNELAIRILDQSVMNCWQNIYELKSAGNKEKNVFDEWRDA